MLHRNNSERKYLKRFKMFIMLTINICSEVKKLKVKSAYRNMKYSTSKPIIIIII